MNATHYRRNPDGTREAIYYVRSFLICGRVQRCVAEVKDA